MTVTYIDKFLKKTGEESDRNTVIITTKMNGLTINAVCLPICHRGIIPNMAM